MLWLKKAKREDGPASGGVEQGVSNGGQDAHEGSLDGLTRVFNRGAFDRAFRRMHRLGAVSWTRGQGRAEQQGRRDDHTRARKSGHGDPRQPDL